MRQREHVVKVASKYHALITSIALFLVLDMCVLVLNFYLASQIQRNAAAVNLAGRQRMLSQRMVKALYGISYAEGHGGNVARSLSELHATVSLFDRTLNAFAHGGVVPGGTGSPVRLVPVSGRAAHAIIKRAFTLWRPYGRLIGRLKLNSALQVPPGTLGPAIHFAIHNNLRLLALMNQLTTAMQQVATTKANRLRLIQVTAMALALGNFALILFHFLRQLSVRDEALEVYERSLEKLLEGKELEIRKIKERYEALLTKDAPTASEAEQVRRRCAIHRALSRFREKGLSEHHIMEALWIFQERYNARAHIVLSDFVDDVTRLARAPGLRQSLHAEILKHYARPLEKGEVDPLPAMTAYRKQNEGAELSGLTTITASFALALTQVLHRLEALDRGRSISLRMFIATRLHSLALDRSVADEIRDYLVKPSRPPIQSPVELHTAKHIMNLVWEWCLEYFGDPITQSVFERSAENVKKLWPGAIMGLFPAVISEKIGVS